MAGNTPDWATAILGGLGIAAPSPIQRGMIQAWIAGEGTAAANNPLATTQGAPGATNYNSVGVKNYLTFDAGLKATVDTLHNGYYQPIIDAIRAGNATAFNNAVISSPWGTESIPAITPAGGPAATTVPPAILSGISALASRFGMNQGYGPTTFTGEPPGDGYAHFHNGIDVLTPMHTPIYALSAGTITAAGSDATGIAYGGPSNFGTRILETVGNGFTQLFGHLSSVTVTPGQRVQAGQLIGYTGSSGNSTGPHLHIGLYQGSTAVNPLTGEGAQTQGVSDVTAQTQAQGQYQAQGQAQTQAHASPYMLSVGLPLGNTATIDMSGPMRIIWLLIGLLLMIIGIWVLNKNGVQKIVGTASRLAAVA